MTSNSNEVRTQGVCSIRERIMSNSSLGLAQIRYTCFVLEGDAKY